MKKTWISGIERAAGTWDGEVLGSGDIHLMILQDREVPVERLTAVEVIFSSGERRQRALCQRHLDLFMRITERATRKVLGQVRGRCDYCVEDARDARTRE